MIRYHKFTWWQCTFLLTCKENGAKHERKHRASPLILQSDLFHQFHWTDVIMGAMASQITSLTIVYSTLYSGADQRQHQSSLSLAFVQGIHRWPVNSLHKGLVTWKMFLFDDVIMSHLFSEYKSTLLRLAADKPILMASHWQVTLSLYV